MDALKLRTIILTHRSSVEACASALVEASQGCSLKALEDAFAVALRTGTLEASQAKGLLSAIEEIGGGHFQEASFCDAEISALRKEIESLAVERQLLEQEDADSASLQIRIRQLVTELSNSNAKLNSISGEVMSIEQDIIRLDNILKEVNL